MPGTSAPPSTGASERREQAIAQGNLHLFGLTSINLGIGLTRSGRHAEGRLRLQEALPHTLRALETSTALEGLGDSFRDEGHASEAADHYAAAIAVALGAGNLSDAGKTLLHLAVLHLSQARTQLAERELERASELTEPGGRVDTARARLALAGGRFREACDLACGVWRDATQAEEIRIEAALVAARSATALDPGEEETARLVEEALAFSEHWTEWVTLARERDALIAGEGAPRTNHL